MEGKKGKKKEENFIRDGKKKAPFYGISFSQFHCSQEKTNILKREGSRSSEEPAEGAATAAKVRREAAFEGEALP
ncbi:hypothetical protein DsansV1_C05g0054091 [Dioscorea sansibarensis]